MHEIDFFREYVEKELRALDLSGQPDELYEPVRYMLSLGGKRIRPSLVLMANELFDGNIRDARGPALGIEVFHNFTLLHDDIMDKAPLRRNQQTVHTRWNGDIAILAGDTMFVIACQLMMQSAGKRQAEVMDSFLRTAAEVCEGQQMDMNFENREDVSIQEYLEMISRKTAVLIGCSLKIGAITANSGEREQQAVCDFGRNLGIAFQLHDDLLDVYGNTEKVGKQEGGDILAGKKTILILLALQDLDKEGCRHLLGILKSRQMGVNNKIQQVKAILTNLNVRGKAESLMDAYFRKALDCLENSGLPSHKTSPLRNLADQLMVREH
ncbi:MAG: polyprenyl synthetase family protein [Bacteroidia bacterium]|nr:polyprenyl synthetase family protein [Bacteroidia bacterium]